MHNIASHNEATRTQRLFHHALIHTHRRTQHAAANVGKTRKFEQPLYRPIFTVGPVQQGNDNVDAHACTSSERHQFGSTGIGGRNDRFALNRERWRQRVARAAEQRLRLRRNEPLPARRDGDRHDFVALRVERGGDRNRGHARNVVFSGAPAEKQHDFDAVDHPSKLSVFDCAAGAHVVNNCRADFDDADPLPREF